jgi:anti-anti-sigma regulatory factor
MVNLREGQAFEPKRERDDAVADHQVGISRSFDPGSLPAPVKAFADGSIDQARIGRILMVSARVSEVTGANWSPFARWLADEVRTVNGVRGCLVLDLRRVERLSARGLRALALAWQELAEGGVIAVCSLSPRNAEIFKISQYDRLFEIYADSTAAYRALAARARPPA